MLILHLLLPHYNDDINTRRYVGTMADTQCDPSNTGPFISQLLVWLFEVYIDQNFNRVKVKLLQRCPSTYGMLLVSDATVLCCCWRVVADLCRT